MRLFKFVFRKSLKNNHGQVIIPMGISGTMTLEMCKSHLTCDKIIPGLGTNCFSANFRDIENCLLLKEIFDERLSSS